MTFDLPYKSDKALRSLMLAEVEYDIRKQNLYTSRKLIGCSKEIYVSLLTAAVLTGDEETLALELCNRGCFGDPEGGQVSHDAVVAAQDEMNRFCMRAVCVKALDQGQSEVEIYRARESKNPRAESQKLIGNRVSAELLLSGLRKNNREETIEGLGEPNSGLSVRHLTSNKSRS